MCLCQHRSQVYSVRVSIDWREILHSTNLNESSYVNEYRREATVVLGSVFGDACACDLSVSQKLGQWTCP